MCDDDHRPSTVPPPPPSEPKAKGLGSIRGVQNLLKQYGYVLTAMGPYRVSFYPANVKRTPEGLVPDDQWHHLSPKGFRAFVQRLQGKGGEGDS